MINAVTEASRDRDYADARVSSRAYACISFQVGGSRVSPMHHLAANRSIADTSPLTRPIHAKLPSVEPSIVTPRRVEAKGGKKKKTHSRFNEHTLLVMVNSNVEIAQLIRTNAVTCGAA